MSRKQGVGKTGDADAPKGGDVWLTLGQTASMSPDELARRGGTPVRGTGPEAVAGAIETPPADVASGPGPDGVAPVPALPLEDSTRYELEGIHARGGLGRVVRARDRLLRRTVAIKELLQRTPSAQARFLREALITARLQHPGIVPVHEAGCWPSGDPYYSMKLVSGRTLKELIQARGALEERLALLPHVLAVAEAIAYAHSQDVIHRDIKPANVIVGDFGETVVVDWGLAKDLSGRLPEDPTGVPPNGPESGSRQAVRGGDPTGVPAGLDDAVGSADPPVEQATATGHIMGTPAYMAPEQARGDVSDERADVYSLGAMLYELLAGAPPHTGDSADQVLKSALSAAPIPIELRQPHAPPDLVAIVHKAMAVHPTDRYPSATPLAEDIRRFQTGQLVTARRYSTRNLIRRWIGRHRGVVAVAAAAAVALAATGAVAFQRVVAQRNLAEARRAEAQQSSQRAIEKSNDMTFLQAQSWLARDPTAALAWLKRYPQGGPRADQVGAMVDEAIELGVARHVLRLPTWIMGLGFTGDGRGMVGVLKSGEVYRWDVVTGAERAIGRHGETVSAVRVSPDGNTVAVGGASGAVALFSLEDRGPRRQLASHEQAVGSLGFSADSRRLLTGSVDRVLRVWDLRSPGRPLLEIKGEQVKSVELAPDGHSLFLGLRTGEVARVWVATRVRERLATLSNPIVGLASSADGRHLAVTQADGPIAIVDLAERAVRGLELEGGKHGLWGFSATGRYLAATSTDGSVHLHEMATGEDTVLRGHEDKIYEMRFSDDDSELLTASDDATARVWDLRSRSVRVLRGHEDDVTHAAFSPDGTLALTGGIDSSLRLWRVRGGEAVSRIVEGRFGTNGTDQGDALLLASGTMVLSQLGEDRLEVWDLVSNRHLEQTLPRVDRWDPPYRHTFPPVIDRGGHLYASPEPGGRLALWDLRSGARRDVEGRGAELNAVAISRDGATLVTADAEGTVLIREVLSAAASGARARATIELSAPRVLLPRQKSPRGAALSPAADRLAMAVDGQLRLFDMASGATIGQAALPEKPGDPLRTLDFSPDGRRVLVSGMKVVGSPVLWDLEAGTTRTLDVGVHEVIRSAFSPDSSRLAMVVSDRTVRVVDTATGRSTVLQGHRDMVWSVAWSPDSRSLASASYDRTVRLWDPVTGRMRVLRGHASSVESVAFTADGRSVVSASSDGTVRRWHLDRLPDDRADVVAQRLSAATTAIIGAGGGAATLTIPDPTPLPEARQDGQASRGGGGSGGAMPGAGRPPAAGWAPAR